MRRKALVFIRATHTHAPGTPRAMQSSVASRISKTVAPTFLSLPVRPRPCLNVSNKGSMWLVPRFGTSDPEAFILRRHDRVDRVDRAGRRRARRTLLRVGRRGVSMFPASREAARQMRQMGGSRARPVRAAQADRSAPARGHARAVPQEPA